jgi:hypothetical protein
MKKLTKTNDTMPIDWTQLFKKYKGLWVALAADEKTVVASSKSAKDAYEQARKKGVDVPIMLSVPMEFKSHIGFLVHQNGSDEVSI